MARKSAAEIREIEEGGPLGEGELDRARRWGAALARQAGVPAPG
jgi:hypothetical protein